jgi:hypothetical protein
MRVVKLPSPLAQILEMIVRVGIVLLVIWLIPTCIIMFERIVLRWQSPQPNALLWFALNAQFIFWPGLLLTLLGTFLRDWKRK